MPTVIDSLVVKLGLDSKDLSNKTPTATKDLKSIETQADKTKSSINDVTAGLAKLLALIGGSYAIKNFISDFIDTNAALERFSRNVNSSIEEVSAWGNAVEEVGGSAQGLQQSIQNITNAQNQMLLEGNSSMVPYLSALGLGFADASGKALTFSDFILNAADAVQNKISQGMSQGTANYFLKNLGLDQGTINLILQGRKEVELSIIRQKEQTAASKAQGEEAVKLQKQIVSLKNQFTAFGREIFMEASPGIEYALGLLKKFGDWVGENKEVIADFFKVLVAGLAAVAVGMTLAAAAAGELDLALDANPIGLATIAIVALAAAVALLWQDYQVWKRGGESFVDWGVWADRVDEVKNAVKYLREELEKLATASTNVLNKIPGYAAFDKWFSHNQGDKTSDLAGKAMGIEAAGAKSIFGIRDNNSIGRSPAAIQKWFEGQGWTAAQAAGIVANLKSENSTFDTTKKGDNGSAIGIAQWHPDRQAAFKELFGEDIGGASLEKQLAFVQYELTLGSKAGVGKALAATTSASDAGALISRRYESPKYKDGEAQRRGDLAAQLAGVKGASSTIAGAGAGAAASPSNVDQSKTINTGDVIINTKATDAAGIARDLSQSMDYLFTSQANAGTF